MAQAAADHPPVRTVPILMRMKVLMSMDDISPGKWRASAVMTHCSGCNRRLHAGALGEFSSGTATVVHARASGWRPTRSGAHATPSSCAP